MQLTLPAQVVLAIEILIVLIGCVFVWRQVLCEQARKLAAERARLMPAWVITVPDFFLFLFCVIAGGVLAQSAASFVVKPQEVSTALSIVVHGGAFHAGMLAGVWLFKRILKREARDQRTTGNRWAQGVTTFLIALPLLAATGLFWQTLMNALGVELHEQDLVGIFAATKSPLLLGSMIVLAIVIAPVTEELIFRAGIFRYLRTRFPRWAALLVPALLFAALHGNLASFAPLTVLGIIFSLAYERTGSIAVPMIAHGLFNLNTIVLILAGLGLGP